LASLAGIVEEVAAEKSATQESIAEKAAVQESIVEKGGIEKSVVDEESITEKSIVKENIDEDDIAAKMDEQRQNEQHHEDNIVKDMKDGHEELKAGKNSAE